MYILQPQLRCIDFAHKGVLSLIQSVNTPLVAAGDFPAEESQAFVISLESRDRSLECFIYLHLQASNLCVIYRYDPSPFMLDRLQTAESEALDFVESMGFMMDNLNFSRLAAADQARLCQELPVFYPDLEAYLPQMEKRREGAIQNTGLTPLGEDPVEATLEPADESPSQQFFQRSDFVTAEQNPSEIPETIKEEPVATPPFASEEAPFTAIPLEEPLAEGPAGVPEQVDLGGLETAEIVPELPVDQIIEDGGEGGDVDAVISEYPTADGPQALASGAVILSSTSDEELSNFFQPESIQEMVAEIDRSKSPNLNQPEPPRSATPPVAPPISPQKPSAVATPTKESPRTVNLITNEEKVELLKLILTV